MRATDGDTDGDAARPVVCWGEVLWDLFPDQRRLGGAPANVAVHLAALGQPAVLVTRVGDDDEGREAIAAVAARGVDTARIQVDPGRPTGRVDIELHDGEPAYRLTPGCAWEVIAADDDTCATLARAAAFCFGTLSQIRGLAALDRALAALPADCLTVCDLNLRPRFVDDDIVRTALAAARVVKLNELEVRLVAERLATGPDSRPDGIDLPEAVARLQDRFDIALVAVTRGPRGCALFGRGQPGDPWPGLTEDPGVPARPGGDNVGAGDAFTAALVAGLRQGWSLDRVARAANRYAAFVASRPGATPAVPDEVVAGYNADS